MKVILFAFACLLFFGCSSPPPNKFSDSTLSSIADFKDRRLTDSLISYLINRNSTYRSEAALALASVQDSAASLQLGTMLLEDPFQSARIHAAFALGQTGGNAAVNALIPALTDTNSLVISETLQGLGKTITVRDLTSLLDFQPSDSIQEHGLVWGFYFAGLRGLADSIMTERAADFLALPHSTSVRLGAAHFFNRSANIKLIPSQELIRVATEDTNPLVRMAATMALRKVAREEYLPAIKQILTTDQDYRVRVNAARVASTKSSNENDDLVLLALQDTNAHVAVAAAEGIQNDFKKRNELLVLAHSTKNFRVQSALYKTLLNGSPALTHEIQEIYMKSSNDYHKASLLTTLSSDINAYSFIAKELIESKIPVIKTSAAQALTILNRSHQFSEELKPVFADLYKNAILNADPSVIGIVSSALADSTLGYRSFISDYSFLQEVRNTLTLPKDYEAIKPLDQALAWFEGRKKPVAPKNEFNHPINWTLVRSISKNQRVQVFTDKGKITLALLVEEAPGSVANFFDLMNQKYFDGRFVHRVVPNFVIQAGCNRGDGYGNEAYSIRSEFSVRRYEEGSVGMASAGKDTEGTQWFITHSPTPHLDGRYTLFATVVSGMDVVHKIEVGDQIIRMVLLDN
jgi:cyclophilin family peptidyl-prolyl cis-trans isomerase/HEAT repeat protein